MKKQTFRMFIGKLGCDRYYIGTKRVNNYTFTQALKAADIAHCKKQEQTLNKETSIWTIRVWN